MNFATFREKECKRCGREFLPAKTGLVYCCEECRIEAEKDRQRRGKTELRRKRT